VREIAAAVVRNAGLWVPEIVSPAPEPGSGSLVEAFTRNAPQEQRAKFIEILGLMLHNTDTPAPAVLGRLQQLWEWRFNQLRTTPDADTGELAGFGWWFGSGKLGPDWALAHLQELRNR